jgi:hypothetical protein
MSEPAREPESVRPAEGWGWPYLARKCHYFTGDTSLCRRWLYTGELSPDTGTTGPDDCTPCTRRLAARRTEPTP